VLCRFVATYEYTEIVGDERREFVHESIIEAASEDAAGLLARNRFDELARQSSVGWRRILHRCEIAPAPEDATPKGGTRVDGERMATE